ncbi:MAG: hypothetical protein ACQSGP_20570 [Frankia sp.]
MIDQPRVRGRAVRGDIGAGVMVARNVLGAGGGQGGIEVGAWL